MNLKKWSLTFAWLVALAGTFMSLYYSVILLKEPCYLCWYQRIALFPLSIQLGIAAYAANKAFSVYAYPLCFFGFFAAVYQSLLPIFPQMERSCSIHGNCTVDIPFLFGVPLPWLSAIGFILIAALVWLHPRQDASS